MKKLERCDCGRAYWLNEFETCEDCLKHLCFMLYDDIHHPNHNRLTRRKKELREFLYPHEKLTYDN